MIKKPNLDQVKNLLVKRNIEDKPWIDSLDCVLSEITGELFEINDISNFPTAEVLLKSPEEYIEFLKGLFDKYKLSPVGVKIPFRYKKKDSEEDIYVNDIYNLYLSEENCFGFNIEMDGPIPDPYTLFIDHLIYCSESSDIIVEFMKEYKKFFKEFREKIEEESDMHIKLLYTSEGRLNWRYLDIPPRDTFDLEDNYSKDFNEFVPKKMDEFINGKSGGIAIFRGEPGTGKSSYCKYLISKYQKDVDFVIVSQDIILQNPEAFRTFLISNASVDNFSQGKIKKQIFIIEDCEKLLIDRDSLTGNSTSIILSDILNYSDGIVGDLVQSKFIFTFNTNLSKIDKALLRKGRMKLNYEFKKLQGEDLKKLSEKKGLNISEDKIKSGMTLAEIYNLEEENYLQEGRKIGF